MILPDRIRERLTLLTMSQAELARQVGIAQPTIARLLSGSSKSSSYLHRIARVLQTTPAYLSGETDDAAEGALPVPTLQSMNEAYGQVTVQVSNFGRPPEYAEASLYGVRILQLPTYQIEPLVSGSFDRLFGCQIAGVAMSPTLVDGDICIVDQGQWEVNTQDKIWAISHAGIGDIKRIRRKANGNYLLLSDNTVLPPLEVNKDDLTIVGRVIWRSGAI